MSKKSLVIGAAVVVLGAGGAFLLSRNANSEPKFRTVPVDRGDVVSTVSAAGTLSAVTTVLVGSQVSGIIAKRYVDYNSEVKKGQLLAELDPTPFQATVEQRRADLEKMKVDLRNAELQYVRAKNLAAQQLVAQSELDTALANRDSAAASVRQSQATLKQAQTNLEYTKIASPIDGVVVDKQFDVGQTVAASFQAPTLFTIAQDLTKMRVLTNIDESDIGRVKMGQEAMFTVDAFPDRPFRGAVSQVRLSPQTVQNVVTYPVMIDVANPDQRLKPGMTANVQIPVDRRVNVLRVPNAALRFKPDDDDLVPEAKKTPAASTAPEPTRTPSVEAPSATPEANATPAAEGGPPAGERRRRGGEGGAGDGSRGAKPGGGGGAWSGGGGAGRGPGGGRGASRGGVVYVLGANEKLKPVKVKSSITDGNFTAVESDELHEGDPIVIGLATLKAATTGGRSPVSGGGGGGGGRGQRF